VVSLLVCGVFVSYQEFPPKPVIGGICQLVESDERVHTYPCLVDPRVGSIEYYHYDEIYTGVDSDWAATNGDSIVFTVYDTDLDALYLNVFDFVDDYSYNSTSTLPFSSGGVSSAVTVEGGDDAWTIVALNPDNGLANLYLVDVDSGDVTLQYTLEDPDNTYGFGELLFSDPYVFLLTPCRSFFPNSTTQTLFSFDTSSDPWEITNITLTLTNDYVCFYMPWNYDNDENELYLQTGDSAWTGYSALIDVFEDPEDVIPTGDAFGTGFIAIPPYSYNSDYNILYSLAMQFPPVDPNRFGPVYIASQDYTTKSFNMVLAAVNETSFIQSLGPLFLESISIDQ